MVSRVTLTVKLTVGKDDDLIAWLSALPKGCRQAVIKDMLRGIVQQDHPEISDADQLAQIGQDTAWLRAALSDLPNWMESLLSRVAVVQAFEPSGVKPARTGQLSTEGVTRREKRIAKTAW